MPDQRSAQLAGLLPAGQNQLGNIFVAPTGYLKTFAASLGADGSQAVTLALFTADAGGPFGPPLWTQAATIAATGSIGTFVVQTFTVDQPLNPGQTYAFAIIAGLPTANV
jgi:hypothetical protein